MISTGNRFGGIKQSSSETPAGIQKGKKTFTTVPESEAEYTLSIQDILFDESSTFAFTLSFTHQAHELFLVESPVITGMDDEGKSVNVRLKIRNEGKGAFEATLFYTIF